MASAIDRTASIGARRHVAMLVRNAYTHDTRVMKEARTLVDAGYEVTIVADARRGLPERETRDGSRVIRVAGRPRSIPGLGFARHQVRLARVIERLSPDVLHAHDSNALLPVALAARRLKAPFVYDAHDLWLGRPRRERSRLYFVLSQAYYALVERLLVPRAGAVLTVSAPIVAHLRKRYRPRKVALVPNYPDLPIDARALDLRRLAGAEGLDPGLPIVLYLGGLMAGRGLEELVDAMAHAPDAQLVLLGSGVLEEELQARAASAGTSARIHILPPVPPDDVVAYAASAQIGVSPIVPSCLNYRYSLPNKLFQYMAAALPVVASDFPQVREIVQGARCGLVVDTTRPEAIADALVALLAGPSQATEMGARGRAAVTDRYNWSTSASVLLETYATL